MHDRQIDHARQLSSAAELRALHVHDGHVTAGFNQSPGGAGAFETLTPQRRSNGGAERRLQMILRYHTGIISQVSPHMSSNKSFRHSCDTLSVVRGPNLLPFHGHVIWLTADQGGRTSGPPPTPEDADYAATAYVPPAGPTDGLASLVLRAEDRSAWRSPAAGGWLIVANDPPQRVQAGCVVVITEGARDVAYFRVDKVADASAQT